MTNEQLELLLYEEESATLDFKRDQYAFAKASEVDKSELLKDLVGFANAWRRTEAIILIGVQEVRAGRSIVHGVSEHLDDHSLQQFVNNLLNRPLQFGYEARELDGKAVGVLRIPCQRRPFFLRRDYGKLLKEKVYIRRGSSISLDKPADLDEVASMGADPLSALGSQASFEVAFADLQHYHRLATPLAIHSEYLRLPQDSEIDSYGDAPQVVNGLGRSFQIPAVYSLNNQPNAAFYREVARYHWFKKLFTPVRLEVKNNSSVTAGDVVIEINCAEESGFYLADYQSASELPKSRTSFYEQRMPKVPPGGFLRSHPGRLELEQQGVGAKLVIQCGVIQPGRSIWSDEFFVAVRGSELCSMAAVVYSSSRHEPQVIDLAISPSVAESALTLDDLYAIADKIEEEQQGRQEDGDDD